MHPPRSLFRAPFPLALAVVWAWGTMVVLLLLLVPGNIAALTPRTPNHWLFMDSLWAGSDAPLRLSWIHVLMVVWLWVGYRTPSCAGPKTRRATTVGLLASALILLLLSWAILASVRAAPIPDWSLVRIHP